MAKKNISLVSRSGVEYRKIAITKRRRKGKAGVSVAIIAGLMPATLDVLSAYRIGGVRTALEHVSMVTTGYDPSDGKLKLDFAVKKLYMPMLLGYGVHKLANKFGINRAIRNTGIPFISI